MMNKTAYGGIPKIVNFIMAIIVLAGGALPLLVQFGTIAAIPEIPAIILYILLCIAGILLLFDGIIGSGDNGGLIPRPINIIVAIIVLIGGVLPLLNTFGIGPTISAVPIIVFQGLLILGGFILLLDGILGAKDSNF